MVDRFQGLDMNHGFIKSIIKNQIDRDEYHKVMEERKKEIQQIMEVKSKRSREKEGTLYIPPHLRRQEAGVLREAVIEKRKNPYLAVINEFEEWNLREKVRSRTRAHMTNMGDISFTGNPGQSELSSTPLFLLNLTSTAGEKVEVAIMSTDNAARLAKELGRKYGFSDEQCRMLRLTLDQELEARLGK